MSQGVGLASKSTTEEWLRKSFTRQEQEIRKICEDHELSISGKHIWREKQGFSGKHGWTDADGSPAEDNDGNSNTTRPVLTKIVRGIVAGEIGCLVVWSLGHLTTCVETMDALITIMVKYSCHLYDRHGPVDISSVEVCKRIHCNMAAALAVRELARISAGRDPHHFMRYQL